MQLVCAMQFNKITLIGYSIDSYAKPRNRGKYKIGLGSSISDELTVSHYLASTQLIFELTDYGCLDNSAVRAPAMSSEFRGFESRSGHLII